MRCSFLSKLYSVFFLTLIMLSGQVKALPFSDLYVFGDSLVDAGNILEDSGGVFAGPVLVPDPAKGYFNGRYSNGTVYVDYLSEAITGSRTTASLLGGNNYAYGAAQTLGGFTPNLGQQVSMFAADNGNVADPNALYVINFGGNDLLAGNDFGLVIQEMINQIGVLNSLGARRFLVGNMPALQLAPIVPASDKPLVEFVVTSYNSAFEQAMDNFEMLMGSALDITIMDLFNPLVDLINDPAAFGAPAGFAADGPCLDSISNNSMFTGLGGTLENCLATRAFMDVTHPSAFLHSVLGSVAINSVPAPGILILMLSGLILLAFRRKNV